MPNIEAGVSHDRCLFFRIDTQQHRWVFCPLQCIVTVVLAQIGASSETVGKGFSFSFISIYPFRLIPVQLAFDGESQESVDGSAYK